MFETRAGGDQLIEDEVGDGDGEEIGRGTVRERRIQDERVEMYVSLENDTLNDGQVPAA